MEDAFATFDESFNYLDHINTPYLSSKIKGKFPVESFHPCYLEMPKDSLKMNLCGRSNYQSKNKKKSTNWINRRIIELPIYDTNRKDSFNWREITNFWSSSSSLEDIPCITLVFKIRGYYSAFREAQVFTVLLVWPGYCRMLELDWYEGPEDDCITPEWYIHSHRILTLDRAIKRLNLSYKNEPGWTNIIYSIYVNPYQIGNSLKGDKQHGEPEPWIFKWNYSKEQDFRVEMDNMLCEICKIME
ncbi:MAG: hypothetical protein EAX86_09745 [Candidatus Heimdallarchaeota archaeon]|nr:hypothetical protein [Candidatus Heimdallarchaeota archaeon]